MSIAEAVGTGLQSQLLPGLKPALDPDRNPGTALLLHPIRVLAYVHLRNIHRSTGAGRVARQLCEHLALRGDIQLRILADEADRARVLPLVGEPWSSYQYSTFPADTSWQQARWLTLGSPRAERFWPEAQLVFCTAESYVPTRHAPSVVTLHDAAYFEQGEHGAHRRGAAYWKQRLKWQLLYRRLGRKVDLFHTVSQFSAERLGHFFPAIRSRLRVVHNAVSPHFFAPVQPGGTAFLHEHGLAERPFVLVPGGLHYRKNAELILEAVPALLREHPGLLVAVVNHSDSTYAARAEALGSGLRMLGFVPEEALRALYGAAAVVWFPSRYEGFGLPVIEAMACGAPVVASDASSLPEIAGDAALLRAPGDAKAHAGAILSLLGDERAAAGLAEKGRARARQFTWERSADEMVHVFRSLV